MRHRKKGRKLGVNPPHRKAMLRNLASNLIEHKRIKTTDSRAKELRSFIEPLITKAKKGDLNSIRQISKKIPIYILSYHAQFLKFKIERLGFKVIEISNFEKVKLSENFSLSVIAADNCDPELCYKFNGCADVNIKGETQQIDSLSIINCNNQNILNINDCPYELAKSVIGQIKKSYNIDALLVGYGGAGPYPQCFENLDYEQKKIRSYTRKYF